MILRSSAAAELVASTLVDAPYHPRRSEIAVLSDGLGMPSLLKLHWLKIDTRSKTAKFIYTILLMSMMRSAKAIFVAGTGTGVGKTVVAGCLARFILQSGYSVITQKWMETGCGGDFSGDIQAHLKIMGWSRKDIKDYLTQVCPYRFKKGYSPHLAARLEHRKIDPDKIIRSFKVLSQKFDFVIVEGVGGVLVPFNEKSLVIDIAKTLNLPVLVVAQNKLGGINHALLTIEALKARKMKILGIIFNNLNKEDPRILKDNPRIIEGLSGEKVFGVLPKEGDKGELYRKFVPIGKRLLRRALPSSQ